MFQRYFRDQPSLDRQTIAAHYDVDVYKAKLDRPRCGTSPRSDLYYPIGNEKKLAKSTFSVSTSAALNTPPPRAGDEMRASLEAHMQPTARAKYVRGAGIQTEKAKGEVLCGYVGRC